MPAPSLAELFWTFLRIGAMGFGGPYALVSLIGKVVVNQKGWMTTETYAESTGMGSMVPGPISSNTSAVVGYRLRGWVGGLVAYTAFHLPAVTVVLVLAAYFQQVESLKIVQGALKGLSAAVIGLLVAVGWKMGKGLIREWKSAAITVAAFLGLVLWHVNPGLIVLGMGAVGYLAFRPAGR